MEIFAINPKCSACSSVMYSIEQHRSHTHLIMFVLVVDVVASIYYRFGPVDTLLVFKHKATTPPSKITKKK